MIGSSERRRMSARRVITAMAVMVVTAACSERAAKGGDSGTAVAPPAGGAGDLASPDVRAISTPAPDSFRIDFETTKGRFQVAVYRSWAPLGADRLYHLVRAGFFSDVRFFRVLPGFMAQFGMNGTPAVTRAWDKLQLQDDPAKESNARGTISFATSGPNTRTTQLFINYVDNKPLDGMGFTPVGKVIDGMAVVDSLYSGYGEGPPSGFGPDQSKMEQEGNAYLAREFSKLDYIKSARIVGSP